MGGSDRIPETYKASGGWRTDGGSSSNSSTHLATGGYDGVGFERREFDPKTTSDVGIGGAMKASTSLQSLVESIDDDHVFRLTEMTKKRVEHNNPTQKRQRVVSFPAAEASFQLSEKTLQLSSSCKVHMESRYSQLYQSINAGHPINRLRRLHDILPQIKPSSLSKPAHDTKTSQDLGHSRSRRLRNDKYRFVDKVEESSCIWDLDLIEAKAAAQAAAEAALLAKQSAVASSRHGSQHNLEYAPSHDAGRQQLSSPSTDSLGVGKTLQGDTNPPVVVFSNQPQYDSPLAIVDPNGVSMGLSPSSTFSSVANSHHVNDSTTNSSSSLDRSSPKHPKEALGESKLRIAESYPSGSHGNSTQNIKPVDGGFNPNGLESLGTAEASSSKRNSFLGLFNNIRGKKVGQDSDALNTNHEAPQFSSHGSPRLTATATTQERRSFDSQRSSQARPGHVMSSPGRRRQSVMELGTLPQFNPTSALANGTTNPSSPFRTSLEEGTRNGEYGESNNAGLTDDEFGGHFTPPSLWPPGDREDSQDESDTAHKRSSLRRFKDRMTWKRGNKTLSVIQQGEPLQSPADGSKSIGKKSAALAHFHGLTSGRASTSEPSSGRNSMEGPRPKPNNRILSSTSSPVLDAVKNPDGIGFGSPRVGPSIVGTDKYSMANPASTERSPAINPRTEKSPILVADSGLTGEVSSGNATTDITKQTTAPQLLIDVDRIPKRLLKRLQERPELSSVNWSDDTVDLSAMWTSPDPPPMYEEYVGISGDMKSSRFFPGHLDQIDVLEIHLTLGTEEPRDIDSKNRANRWDMLELRIDQEVAQGEKWLKEVSNWSTGKNNAIDRHQQQELTKNGGTWTLDDNAPLVEEPEAEEGAGDSVSEEALGVNDGIISKNEQRLQVPRERYRARKQQRDMSLLSVRDLSGSMSSLHTSMAYTFKASVEMTREAVKEMNLYLEDCRGRLKQLDDATGERLQTQELIFGEVVDKFSKDWNDTYFVKLKEVEDEIQVLNLKRIENPWMDMLLIMLSWFIRGLFYIVEGVTIMIIIVRHAWGKAKKGYDVVRNPRREQERRNYGGGRKTEADAPMVNGPEPDGTSNNMRTPNAGVKG